ncbi:hypothetical protein pEaSNUABM11_00177 [Erwinia phage pEa_SNUABM_11]|nr:hypothetical protein pEaSNUABM11_00177 [Erwinia phage pEa_SNUABM_11]
MGIKLTWPSQTAKGITGIEIYRAVGASSTIDRANLPAPLVTLTPGATTYEDNTVVNATVYNYWIASVKNGERVFCFTLQQGYFLDTGPGPQSLLMGDWDTGYFGRVSNTDLFDYLSLNAALGTNVTTESPNYWNKFIFQNRILFIPDKRLGALSYQQLYSFGVAYGTDDSGSIVPTGAATRNQRRVVARDGRNYVVRLPRGAKYSSAGGVDQTTESVLLQGEWRNVIERMFRNGSGTYPRFGEIAVDTTNGVTEAHSCIFGVLYSTTVGVRAVGSSPHTVGTINVTTVGSYQLVLELVIP